MAQDSCGDLTKHETDVLLGLYSGCECLWNTKNPDYRDKKIRVGAIRTIINGMRLETGKDFTTSQMQLALDTISKKYWQELQQALEAENSSGNGYKSQWRWFHFLDSFLRENMLHAQTLGLDVVDTDKPEVKAQKKDNDDDGNDTDDYFCATVDSGDEDSGQQQPPAVSKRRGQMQVLPTQSRTPPPSSSSRPSRSRASSSRRQAVSALINGTDTHSSRKRRREAAVSPATRSSLASAAGASGSSVSHGRQGGAGSSSSAPHTRSTKTTTTTAATAAATATRLTSTEACQSEGLKISAQMADTLKAMQILLATSLTDQDQPAMVFARHMANELQQIGDYAQRKQCMLDLQQVILRYQTKQQPATAAAGIKFEGRDEESEEEEDMVGSGDRGVGRSRASAGVTTATPQQSGEEPLLLYFDTP